MSYFDDQFANAAPAFLDAFGEVWLFPGAVTVNCTFERRETKPEMDATGRVQRQTAVLSWPAAAGVTAPGVDQVLTRQSDGEGWAVASRPIVNAGWVSCDLVRRARVATGGL